MEDNATSGVPESNAVPVTEASLDKYFETGGETLPDNSESEVESAELIVENESHQEAAKPVEAEPKVEKVVPYAALHEERERRKEMQTKVTNLERTFQAVLEKLSSPQQQQQPPSFDEDPIGALQHNQQVLNQHVAQQYQNQQQQAEQQQRNNQLQDFAYKCQQSVREFSKTNTDYLDAYKFLSESRVNEHVAVGYTQEQARQLILEDEMAVASKAYMDGVNPAERIYGLAKMRGFQSTAAGQPQGKMSALQKGMQASKSLSGAGGKASSGGLTLESLAQMSPDELDQALSKDWDKIMKLG